MKPGRDRKTFSAAISLLPSGGRNIFRKIDAKNFYLSTVHEEIESDMKKMSNCFQNWFLEPKKCILLSDRFLE